MFTTSRRDLFRGVAGVLFALSTIASSSRATAQETRFAGTTDSSVIADASASQTPGPVHEWRFAVTGLARPLTHVRVQLVLSHTALGDLSFVLIAPDGTRLTLAAQVGAPTASNASFSNLDGNYFFDDSGGDLWLAAGTAGFGGTIPEGTTYRTTTAGAQMTGGCSTWLDVVFGGMAPAVANGQWRIETRDHRPGNVGGWSDAALYLTQAEVLSDALFKASFENDDIPRANARPAAAQSLPQCHRAPAFDFDGNGYSDFVVARPTVTANGDVLTWYVRANGPAGGGVGSPIDFVLGKPGDQFACGDYDGDGAWDAAVFRPGNPGLFLVRPSSNPALTRTVTYGTNGETAAVGDYTGDGVFDYPQYIVGTGPSSNGRFAVLDGRSRVERVIAPSIFYTTRVIGGPDYTGDGVGDLVQGILNTFQIRDGATSFLGPVTTLGEDHHLLAPGNFVEDARADVAVTGASSNFGELREWHVLPAGSSNPQSETFGHTLDKPTPGDYDGDGLDDPAVWVILPGDSASTFWRGSRDGQQHNVISGRLGDQQPAAARVR